MYLRGLGGWTSNRGRRPLDEGVCYGPGCIPPLLIAVTRYGFQKEGLFGGIGATTSILLSRVWARLDHPFG